MKKIKKLIYLFSVLVFLLLSFTFQSCSPCVSCLDKKSDVDKDNLGKLINSTVDDFAPYLVADNNLFFTSNRGGGTYSKINESNKYGEDVFSSDLSESKWQEAELHPSTFTTDKNEGTVSLFNKYVIVAKSYDEQGFGGSDLYEAEIISGNIQNLKNLGNKINSSRWDSHPTLSPDGKTLIFSSDRLGGKGGADLYKCIRKTDGSWSEPVNLKELNTSKNDYSPHISSDGLTLFFASDGRSDGLGGLDLYVVSLLDYKQMKHLDAPFNSEFDDVFPFLKKSSCKESDTLLFSSDRPGGCGGLDLYASPYSQPKYIIATVIKDKRTGNPLKINSLADFKVDKSSEKINVKAPSSKFDKDVCTGKYEITATAEGYFSGSSSVEVPFNLTDKTYNNEIFLDPYPALAIQGEVMDSCGILPYESEVLLIDTKTKVTVQTVTTVNSKFEFHLPFVEEEQKFEIRAKVPDCLQKGVVYKIISGVKEDQIFNNTIFVEQVPINPAKISYFVTGYYKVNTTDNLRELKDKWTTKYQNISYDPKSKSYKSTYIENPNSKIYDSETQTYKTYDDFAKDVDDFVNTLKIKMVDTILPRFEKVLENSKNAKLLIEINGYVDEREFFGKYVDKSIEVDPESNIISNCKVNNGDDISNKKLSMLRAYYMSEFFVETISAVSTKFQELYKNGKIEIKKYGKGVSDTLKDQKPSDRDYLLALFRHIIVYVKIDDPNRCK